MYPPGRINLWGGQTTDKSFGHISRRAVRHSLPHPPLMTDSPRPPPPQKKTLSSYCKLRLEMNMTSSQPYWGPILFVSSFNMEYDESVIFYASSQRIFFFNLDPTLNSHNSGSKNYSNKNCQFSESPGRQLSDGIPWIPINSFASE